MEIPIEHLKQSYSLIPLIMGMPTEEIPLAKLPITLGRGMAADVKVRDPWVSRMHCQIEWKDGEWILRDLESRHGTLLNDCRVREVILQPGDQIRIGLSTFEFRQHSGSQRWWPLGTAHRSTE